MPNFAPYTGNTQPFKSDDEIIRALYLDIASELEAIFTYDAHVEATSNEYVKKVLKSIRDEEKVHVGELYTLINYVSQEQYDLEISLHNKGVNEVYDLLEECITLYNSKKIFELKENQILYDIQGNEYQSEKGDMFK
jgi:uncharacterized protein